MSNIYKIINEDTDLKVYYNEISILKTIKALDGRHKGLYEYYIELWENLEGKRFNKALLKSVS